MLTGSLASSLQGEPRARTGPVGLGSSRCGPAWKARQSRSSDPRPGFAARFFAPLAFIICRIVTLYW